MDHRSAMVSVSCVIHAANASHCQEVITAKIQAEHCNGGEMCGLSQSYPKPKLCLQLLKITQSRNGQRRWFVICNDGFCDWRPGLLYAACCMVSIVWGQNLSRKLSLHLPFLSSLCYAIRRRFSLRSILRKNYNAINRLYYPIYFKLNIVVFDLRPPASSNFSIASSQGFWYIWQNVERNWGRPGFESLLVVMLDATLNSDLRQDAFQKLMYNDVII